MLRGLIREDVDDEVDGGRDTCCRPVQMISFFVLFKAGITTYPSPANARRIKSTILLSVTAIPILNAPTQVIPRTSIAFADQISAILPNCETVSALHVSPRDAGARERYVRVT